MLVNFNKKNYITVFTTNISYYYNAFSYWTRRSGTCYKNGCTRPKSGTSTSYENALWMNGISWISTLSTKLLENGERDFELVWLQEEDSLNVRCEHFSLLTFCHVLFLKRWTLWQFAGWLKCILCASITISNCISTKLYKKYWIN